MSNTRVKKEVQCEIKSSVALQGRHVCKSAELCRLLTLSCCRRGPRRLCVCSESHLWWGWGRSCCAEPSSTAPGRPGLYSGWCGTARSQLERAQRLWVQHLFSFFATKPKDFWLKLTMHFNAKPIQRQRQGIICAQCLHSAQCNKLIAKHTSCTKTFWLSVFECSTPR